MLVLNVVIKLSQWEAHIAECFTIQKNDNDDSSTWKIGEDPSPC